MIQTKLLFCISYSDVYTEDINCFLLCNKLFCVILLNCTHNRNLMRYFYLHKSVLRFNILSYMKLWYLSCVWIFWEPFSEASILVRNVQHTEHTRQMMDSMKVFFQTFSHGSSHGRDSMWSSFGKGKRKRSSLLQEVCRFCVFPIMDVFHLTIRNTFESLWGYFDVNDKNINWMWTAL